MFKYSGTSRLENTTVSDLLGELHVSPVRPVPASLRGTVIGRGIPGFILCPDLVLQDDTGYMRLDYRYGLVLGNLIFAVATSGKLIGRQLTATGWYRRAPYPYLQLKALHVADGPTYRCRADLFAYLSAAFWLLLGSLLFLLI